MAQQQPEAVTPSAITGPATGNGSDPEPVAVVPMHVAERAGTALRHHARELWLNPDRLLHSLYHGKPGSMAEHMAYLKSAAWVPEEMTGKPRTFLVWAGIAYQLVIAWPLMAAAKALGAAAPHPLCMLALIVLGVILIVLL